MKMEDWLSERQKIKGDWRNALRNIQEKLEGAIEGLPDNPALNAVKEGINIKEINYFTCKKLRDILTSEKDTAQKNWLGQYKNQATKEWEAILTLYHKDNVHLAEAAMIMNQNVQFEIPALRKIVQNSLKQEQELHRKEGEYKRGSDDYKQRYERECQKLGIEGAQVKKELLKRSEVLPKVFFFPYPFRTPPLCAPAASFGKSGKIAGFGRSGRFLQRRRPFGPAGGRKKAPRREKGARHRPPKAPPLPPPPGAAGA